MSAIDLEGFKKLPREERARLLVARIATLGEGFVDFKKGILKATPTEVYRAIFGSKAIQAAQTETLNKLLREFGHLSSNGKRGRGAVWFITFPSVVSEAGFEERQLPDPRHPGYRSPTQETLMKRLEEERRKAAETETRLRVIGGLMDEHGLDETLAIARTILSLVGEDH